MAPTLTTAVEAHCCVTGTPCNGPLTPVHCCNRKVCTEHETAHNQHCPELRDLSRELFGLEDYS